MADLWYPGGVPDPAPESAWGAHADSGEPKFVLHTTEGPLGMYHPDPRVGDGRAYYGNTGTWPNYTLARHGGNPGGWRWRVFNHIPANRSAMGLRNRPGGVETNRDNATQVEIAARAADIGGLPEAALEELARLLAWEHSARGVPLASTVEWVAHPASYGLGARQRLSPGAWDAYAGVCGHQHVPENDHGDPGAVPVAALLSRAREIARGENGMAGADEVAERVVRLLGADGPAARAARQAVAADVLAALRAQVFDVAPPIRQGNAGQVIGATYNKAGALQASVGALHDEGAALRALTEAVAERDVERALRETRDPDRLDRLAALAAEAARVRRAAAAPGG